MPGHDNDVAVANQALLSVGASRITAFDDGSAEARIAEALYPTVVRNALTANLWRFATKIESLPKVTDAPPDNLFKYGYQIPADSLLVIGVAGAYTGFGYYAGRSPANYEIYGSQIWSDLSPFQCEFVFRPDEGLWPDLFVHAVVAQLASAFAMPLTESPELAEFWALTARRRTSRAQVREASQRPGKGIPVSDLILVRQ